MARVAVNLRGVSTDEVGRGDLLLRPDAWPATSLLDVRLTRTDREASVGEGRSGRERAPLPARVMLHVGTCAVEARVRPLGGPAVRLTLPAALPLTAGDRLILRDPGSRRIEGAVVVDADPPRLDRRGAAPGAPRR